MNNKHEHILVLGGGESKGDGQAAVVYNLIKSGIKFDYIIGTSVGAANGAMVAMNKVDELKDLWLNQINNQSIYARPFTLLRSLWRLLRGNSMMNTTRLRSLLDDHIKSIEEFYIPFECAVTNYDSGYMRKLYFGTHNKAPYTAKDVETLKDSIYASMCMPIVMTPALVNDEVMFDGGVRENIALSRAFDLGAERITVVRTARPLKQRASRPHKTKPKHIASHALSGMMDELANRDVQHTLTLNYLAAQASEQERVLYKMNGEELRHADIRIIEPQLGLSWGTKLMDFESNTEGWHNGCTAAERFINSNPGWK